MRVYCPASGMATGIVVLGPCPRLLRDLLRALLQQDPSLEVVEGAPAVHAGVPVVAHVVVGERERAAEVARAVGAEVPVVVVSPDGRWAGRFVGGRLEESAGDVSAPDLLRLATGGS